MPHSFWISLASGKIELMRISLELIAFSSHLGHFSYVLCMQVIKCIHTKYIVFATFNLSHEKFAAHLLFVSVN